MRSASTSTSASATTIILMLNWKPFQTCGTARRKSSGLKNVCRSCPTATSSAAASSLFQDGDLVGVVPEPPENELSDRPVLAQGGDRFADVGLQRAVLSHHGPVALVGVDLRDDATVGARLLLRLRDDDRHVEDQRLTRARLNRVERGGGRGRVNVRLLRRS